MDKRINVPNALAVLRLILAPIIVYFILNSMNYMALILFSLALFTDFIDGKIARKYNLSTRFGKILDPIADKLLYAFVLYGVFIREKLVFWMWFFGIIIILFVITYLLINRYKIKFPTKIGRTCYFFQFVIFMILITGYVNNMVLILLVILIAIPSVDYIINIINVMKK